MLACFFVVLFIQIDLVSPNVLIAIVATYVVLSIWILACKRKKVLQTRFEYKYEKFDDCDPNDVSSVDGMDGHEFEYFCADLLVKNGFSNVLVTPGSGDQGVDVLAVNVGIKYAVQCKNYASRLGNTPIQEVNAGKTFYNCHVGVVMTNSTFTPGAIALANATGVLLWDRSVVQAMMNNAKNLSQK